MAAVASKVTCYKPLSARRAPDGTIVFTASGAFCADPLKLPCGQCIGCKLDHGKRWATRIMHQAQTAREDVSPKNPNGKPSCFVTLTFDDQHLPLNRSVHVRYIQLYIKRLRNLGYKFSYYACGEYSPEKERRAHFHVCLLGVDFSKDRIFQKKSKTGFPLYHSKELDDCWDHQGLAWIGDLTWDSASYTARYVTNKITGPMAVDYYRHTDPDTGEVFQLKPEFATMSRNPALGKDWIKKYMFPTFRDDSVIVKGKATQPPPYYTKELEKHDPELHSEIKLKRITAIKKFEKNNTPERLSAAEVIKLQKITMYKRSFTTNKK